MKVPIATYRFQLNSLFRFEDLDKIADYISALGISDVYASPIFVARRGSSHGYDIIDSTQVSLEMGGEEGFEKVINTIKSYELGWIQDIVPNHMAYDSENSMLMDVLENGEASEFFNYFDIDWDHPYESMKGRLLAPFLGEFYGICLDKADIRLNFGENGFFIQYYDWKFPIKINSYVKVLTFNFDSLESTVDHDDDYFIRFLEILNIIRGLDSITDFRERHRQIVFIKAVLWKIYSEDAVMKNFLDGTISLFNGKQGCRESFNNLDELISEQLFRLCFWKVGNEELNYRRFFTVNGLLCLRMEKPEVFERAHSFIFKLVREEKITGLRIDHVDGLYCPSEYLRKLRQETEKVYIVVEKILGLDEELPSYWPVQGTTGYDFLNHLNGVFVETKNERSFNKIYNSFTGLYLNYDDLVNDKKRLFMGKYMEGDNIQSSDPAGRIAEHPG